MKRRAEIEAAIREISSEIEQMEDDTFEDDGRLLLSVLAMLEAELRTL